MENLVDIGNQEQIAILLDLVKFYLQAISNCQNEVEKQELKIKLKIFCNELESLTKNINNPLFKVLLNKANFTEIETLKDIKVVRKINQFGIPQPEYLYINPKYQQR